MADITKCQPASPCARAWHCYRHTASDDARWQSYAAFTGDTADAACPDYICDDSKLLRPWRRAIPRLCGFARVERKLRPSSIILSGGRAVVMRDSRVVIDGETAYGEHGIEITVADVERLAADDPIHDWRIVLAPPYYEYTYQRHAANLWVLVNVTTSED